MSALGPRGVSITKQNRKEDGQVETSIKQQKGISSLMSDKEFASPVEAVEGGANSATTPTTSGSNLSQAGGSKKKKGKRK